MSTILGYPITTKSLEGSVLEVIQWIEGGKMARDIVCANLRFLEVAQSLFWSSGCPTNWVHRLMNNLLLQYSHRLEDASHEFMSFFNPAMLILKKVNSHVDD